MSSHTRLTLVGGLAALVSVLPLLELTLEASWVLRAGLAMILVTATGHVARRLRVPVLLAALAQLVVLAWWLGLLIAADLAWFGVLPSTTWPDRFVAVFTDGAEAITTFSTPVPVTQGILAYLVVGAGSIAMLVDLLAAGLRRVVFAGVPLAAGYTATAAIEGGDIGWWWFVPPAVGFLAMLITESRVRVSAWGRSASRAASSRGLPETDALARNGRRVGAMALIAAVGIPAFAPVLSDGLVSGRGGGGGGGDGRTIRTDNPILDLQRNLNRPDNVDVLRYRASDESAHYIRIVTLDSFDGEVWQTSDRPVPESQRVVDGLPPPPGLDLDDPPEIEFQFSVSEDYNSRWLPLAYPAQEIDIQGDWRYDTDTLDVVSTDPSIEGTEYTAVSLEISVDAATLQEAGPPDSDVADLTELPDDLPDIVTDLADEVTKDADDHFSKAAALQQWFRGPEFTYDISTQPGTSATALADFLTDRRGYCEQFAASMAIMARYLGIPARVAVGFTPGIFEGDGTYLVRSHDMHAWPELYFEGVGWTLFEPTPAGRTGTAPTWTVLPQDSAPDDESPAPDSTSTSSPTGGQDVRPDEDSLVGGTDTTSGGTPTWPLAVIAALVVLGALAWLPLGLARWRSWHRWRRAGEDPEAMAAASWAELSEVVRDAGFSWDTAATPRSVGRSVSAAATLDDESARLLGHLVSVTEHARYARRAGPVPELREDTELFRQRLLRTRPVKRRLRAFLWPASLSDARAGVVGKISEVLDRVESAGDRIRAWEQRFAIRTRSATARNTDADGT
ncbi:hypothetical protein G1H11_00575 [Phytoactinopolyspora alkaliphila]|uniref:Transglutaminase-like domain-containing protein n=1 Tax=Phytoactinopolyspora alkaliphila TaxID=1783498 RepID=A0A6N9YFX4_9ACTN|nr:DUF3488 and transglutaminase-like domain-containing protein [Phytoactinopolyspora alkaliphila]NED93808.1 hypothetical protein [Phytoactinopolyspora alkaliphila]